MARKPAVKPVAAWPDYGMECVVAMCDDGQLYTLPVLGENYALRRIVTPKWEKLGPPISPNRSAS